MAGGASNSNSNALRPPRNDGNMWAGLYITELIGCTWHVYQPSVVKARGHNLKEKTKKKLSLIFLNFWLLPW